MKHDLACETIGLAILAQCEKSIRSGKPMPPIAELWTACAAPSLSAFNRALATLVRNRLILRVWQDGPRVYQLPDGQCTPPGRRP